MCDDWDDAAAPSDLPQGGRDNQQIYSQNFGNSNFRGARGGHNRNNDRNPRFGRNSGEDSYNRSGGLYRNTRSDRSTSWGNNSNADEQTETLNVPSKYVGRVIGRGGSKINEFQAESGARIQVTKEIIGDETVVKIFGNQDSIDRAKSLINSVTTDTF